MSPEGRTLVGQSMGKSFGRTTVLKGATLWCEAGRIGVLIGRNGSGKTTLLRVTLGLLRADFGAVRMDGWATERPRPAEMARRGVFFSPQAGMLMTGFTVESHLGMMGERGGGDVDTAMHRLKLESLLRHRPHQLSGGERKRVEAALALIRGARVFLADEPLAGIAPADRDLLGAVYRDMADDGVAVVLTGHDAPELFALADRIDWVSAGTTHQLGGPRQALQHEQFVREYLGPGGRRRVREQLDHVGR